jgi:hypothetical protein
MFVDQPDTSKHIPRGIGGETDRAIQYRAEEPAAIEMHRCAPFDVAEFGITTIVRGRTIGVVRAALLRNAQRAAVDAAALSAYRMSCIVDNRSFQNAESDFTT